MKRKLAWRNEKIGLTFNIQVSREHLLASRPILRGFIKGFADYPSGCLLAKLPAGPAKIVQTSPRATSVAEKQPNKNPHSCPALDFWGLLVCGHVAPRYKEETTALDFSVKMSSKLRQLDQHRSMNKTVWVSQWLVVKVKGHKTWVPLLSSIPELTFKCSTDHGHAWKQR